MSVNGDSIKQITFLNTACSSPSWSPSGKEIAFISESKLYAISSEGGTPSVLTDKDVSDEAYWESDSEIFYQKSGNRNFYVFNPSTLENNLLISNDSVGWMFSQRVSPDNSNIAFHWNGYPDNPPTQGLWIISKKDSSQKLLLQGNILPIKWSNDGKWIYAIKYENNSQDI